MIDVHIHHVVYVTISACMLVRLKKATGLCSWLCLMDDL